MPADQIARLFLTILLGGLVIFLLRFLALGLHHTFLLFAIATGFDIVFVSAFLLIPLGSPNFANVGLLETMLDVLLTPLVALELFGSAAFQSRVPDWYQSALILLAGAGLATVLFLYTAPGNELLELVQTFAYLSDTLVTIAALTFGLRRVRGFGDTPSSNAFWVRRLFLLNLLADVLRSLIDPFFPAAHFTLLDSATFGLTFLATAYCVFALRRESKPAASS